MRVENFSASQQNCGLSHALDPVSYTHLDVYKRQSDMSRHCRKQVVCDIGTYDYMLHSPQCYLSFYLSE